MAKHRINENGHIMWFDKDEEYYNYLDMQAQLEKRERKLGRRIRLIIALIALIMLLIIGESFVSALVWSFFIWIVCIAVHYLKPFSE